MHKDRKDHEGRQSESHYASTGAKDAAGSECPVVVVGVGTSAGGLKSLQELFARMPLGHRVAFVLVQHLEPSNENPTISELRDLTALAVVEATDGMPVVSDRIHVMPPDKFLSISGARLTVHEPVYCNGLRMPIDHFFCSLAVDQRHRGCAILLSGTGSDGALGLSEIKSTGGRTLVEDSACADLPDIAQRVIDTGMADEVLPAAAMAEAVVVFAGRVAADTGNDPAESPEFQAGLRAVLDIVRTMAGHDFRSYKPSTLVRRISRRMTRAKIATYAEYAQFLFDNPDEVGLLRKDLLIGVTEFFRQPQAWEMLERKVIARIVENARPGSEIRVWVPGCSTGKEAYSLAMVLAEQMEKFGKSLGIQIFATDSDTAALVTARTGSYSEEDLGPNVSPERRKRFFTYRDGKYQVIKEIRERIVFAPQDVMADPPFSRLDLISCRNLLIYLDQQVQQKLIALFHFSLSEGGFLFLGTAETVGDREDLFEPVSKKWRIYRRIGVGRRVVVEIPVRPSAEPPPVQGRLPAVAPASRLSLATTAQQVLLDRFAPASVMIDRKLLVLYVHGAVEDYLTFPPGELTTRVVDMAREGLRARLRGAIDKCIETNRLVSFTARVRRKQKSVPVKTTVSPLRHPRDADGLLLITFEDYRVPTTRSKLQAEGESDVRQLEDELKVTREELQSTIEQLESSNDLLKASNEEVTAANEELQSANEELETSKEELQSLNEELNTINARLQEKVEELEGANNDVVNLLSSTNIAIVFLDKELKVRRYTSPITRLLSLIPSDIGRPVADVLRRFSDEVLLEDARRVLADLMPLSKEVQADDGRWYIRRITPYRTQDDRIEGVVVTLVDISERREGEEKIRLQNTILEAINKIFQEALTCDTEGELGVLCLTVAEEVTGSKLGFIGEIGPDGSLDAIAVSRLGWELCAMEDRTGHLRPPTNLKMQGIFGRVLQDGKSVLTNDPDSHPDRIGLPKGHPPLTAFLGTPLIQGGKSVGILAVGNREGGYTREQREALEAMAPAILQVLMRKRAEAALQKAHDELEMRVEQRTAELVKVNDALEQEIAERKRSEGVVETERKRFRDVLDLLPAYVVLLSPDYHVPFINRFFRERFGESGGRRCFEWLFGRTEPCEICETYTVMKTGEPHHWEWTGPDGRNYDIFDFPFSDTDGSPLIMEVGIDITELKQAQESLREANEALERRVEERTAELRDVNALLEAEIIERTLAEGAVIEAHRRTEDLLESIGDGFFSLGRDWRITYINEKGALLTGKSREELLGRNLWESFPEAVDSSFYWSFRRTMMDRTARSVEEFYPPLNTWFEAHAYPSPEGLSVFYQDVTERKRAEDALRKSEERLRLAQRAARVGVWDWNIKEQKLDWTPELEKLYGLEPGIVRSYEDLVGLVHHEDLPRMEVERNDAIAGRRPFNLEFRILLPSGEIRWMHSRGGAVYDDSGSPIRVFGINMDVTERKRLEEALIESRKDLDRAQAVAQTGSWRLGVRRNELVWSDENHRIFGVPKGTPLTYETFLGCVHPDDREYVQEKWMAGLRGEPYDIEHRIVAGDTAKWVRERAELEFDSGGELLGGFGTTQDITERKKAERAVRESEARFRLLSETAGRLLASQDPQGIVNDLCRAVMANLDCQTCFNFLVDEHAGRLRLNACAGIPDEEVRKIEWLDFGVAVSGCVAKEGTPIVAEDICSTPDPRTELVKSYGIKAYACHPLMVHDRLIGTLSFGTKTRSHFSPQELALMKTITDQVAVAMERMRLIGELERSRDELELRVQERTAELMKSNEALAQSNRDLEDFAHVASHDLQEPLRKIRTFSDRLVTLYQDSLDDTARDYLQRMHRASERMQALVLDLLRYSRIVSKPEPFTRFALRESVQEAVIDLGGLIEEKDGRIEVDELPEIEADRVQMRQLFQNLIGNGFKYHGERKPVIKIYSPSSSGRFWAIHVEDNGIGFDEYYLDKIFKPFQRLHGRSAPYEGTGMGLAICRRIVERHGGSITAESKPGEGATFIVKLPKKHSRQERIR